MTRDIDIALPERDLTLADVEPDVDLDDLIGAPGSWEVEIGFGKGRYLLRRAEAEPARRFLGVEVARKYHGIFVERARRRCLANVVGIRGEALEVLSTVLPRSFAEALHVYFPDPWPKARHARRRLFDPVTVDLVLGCLRPGGSLFFATDFLDYGETVAGLLAAHPGVDLRRRLRPWPDGARTNYEAKYVDEGRRIVRLEARMGESGVGLHPQGVRGVVVGYRDPESAPGEGDPVR